MNNSLQMKISHKSNIRLHIAALSDDWTIMSTLVSSADQASSYSKWYPSWLTAFWLKSNNPLRRVLRIVFSYMHPFSFHGAQQTWYIKKDVKTFKKKEISQYKKERVICFFLQTQQLWLLCVQLLPAMAIIDVIQLLITVNISVFSFVFVYGLLRENRESSVFVSKPCVWKCHMIQDTLCLWKASRKSYLH